MSDCNIPAGDIAGSIHIDIGESVRQARERLKYTIDNLAVTCGLTAVEINKIELGADLDKGRLLRVASALRIDLPVP